MNLKEETLSKKTIFSGKVFEVSHEEVLLTNNKKAYREVVYHKGGVCILAIKNEEIYFVKQFRYPNKKVLIELPAGKLEDGEQASDAAIRELAEETGVLASTLQALGHMYPSPAYTSEIIYMYYTEDFVIKEAKPDEDEFVEVIKIPLKEALKLINEGKIVDAKTIILIYKYLAFKNINIT